MRSSQFRGLAMQEAARRTDHQLRLKDRLNHLKARLGINRMRQRVEPGLYRLGDPGPESPVFVTANYTLSFDALRSSLKHINACILVLDTSGINVWCAAGKGTFGTDELVKKIEQTNLAERLSHRDLILPQLGAPGVSAHEVRKRSGFRVKYGPVRAGDIPAYLGTGKVSAEARRVKFTLGDRLILIPVELKQVLLPLLLIAGVLYFTVGLLPALALTVAVLAGSAVFPVMLPWLPTKNFSTKGFILGGVVAGVFAMVHVLRSQHHPLIYVLVSALAYLLTLPPLTAFLSLNFTGATTFTSRSGVRKEINTYFPVMVWMAGSGLLLFVAAVILSITVI